MPNLNVNCLKSTHFCCVSYVKYNKFTKNLTYRRFSRSFKVHRKGFKDLIEHFSKILTPLKFEIIVEIEENPICNLTYPF